MWDWDTPIAKVFIAQRGGLALKIRKPVLP